MRHFWKIAVAVFLVILLAGICIIVIPAISQTEHTSETSLPAEPTESPSASVQESIPPEESLLPEESEAISSQPETETETVSEEQSQPQNMPLEGKIICVDAGHGIYSGTHQERQSPDSDITKSANVVGTEGQYQSEEQLNLKVALKLQQLLEEQGATVVMTRTTHESNMTNIERAELANNAGANLSVRIHANGSDDSSVYGLEMMIPAVSTSYLSKAMVDESKVAGGYVLDAVIAETGARDRGFVPRDDLTGFNWSKVPVILIEMGYMTNANEDGQLSSDDYQNKIAVGIVKGVVKYFKNKK